MENGVFDPETCPIEELKKKIEELEQTEEYYNTMQQSAKTFINSVYGYFGTEFGMLANSDIAESITLQGQDLIKFSVVQINDYIKNYWNQDVEGHKRIADKMKGIFGDAFKYDDFMLLAKTNKVMIDTAQIYGDSVTGDSMIRVIDGEKISIEDLFNEICDTDTKDKIRVRSNRFVLNMDIESNQTVYHKIKYIMRHYTNKHIWKIVSGDDVIKCTEDHSIIVKRYDSFVDVKPSELRPADKLIKYTNFDDISYVDVDYVEDLGEYNDYVYDIEVDVDKDKFCHNFFANDLLVHNTDSVSGSTLVRTEKHPNGLTIEDFYKENEKVKLIKLVDCDDIEHTYLYDDYINVKRNGLEIQIKACELQETDEICID